MRYHKNVFSIATLAAVISLSWAGERKEIKASLNRDLALDQYSFYVGELDIPELKKTLAYERSGNKILLDLLGKSSKDAQTLTDKQILTAFNAALDIPGLPDKVKMEAESG